jgi:hypothetical protein
MLGYARHKPNAKGGGVTNARVEGVAILAIWPESPQKKHSGRILFSSLQSSWTSAFAGAATGLTLTLAAAAAYRRSRPASQLVCPVGAHCAEVRL